MVAQVKPMKADKYPLGHAKENKDASAYAKNGTSVANSKSAVTKPMKKEMDTLNISVAGISKNNLEPDNKHPETKQRGYGAATKGFTSRGPMA